MQGISPVQSFRVRIKLVEAGQKRKCFYSDIGPYFVSMSSNVPAPPRPPRPIATPCVKVCIVDGASGLCLGCWRTLSEIGAWSGFSDAERAAIMAELPGRAAEGGVSGLGASP